MRNGNGPHDDALAGLPLIVQALYERIGMYPYPEQKEIILKALSGRYRTIQIAGGGQSSKSTVMAFLWAAVYPFCVEKAQREGQKVYIWMIGQSYDDVGKEFEYIEDWARRLNALAGKVTWPKQKKGFIPLKGNVEVHTYSGGKPETIAGEAPVFIFVCEAARTTPRVLEVVLERTGPGKAIAVFSGTFERDVQTWYHQMYWNLIEGGDPEGFAVSLPSWVNRLRYPGGRSDPEILRQERLHNADYFQERFGGVPVKPRGIVIPEFSGRYHVKPCTYDPDLPLWLTNDPGYGSDHENSNALLAVQQDSRTNQIRVISEIYRLGRTTEQIIDEAMAKRWWNHKPPPVLVVDPYYKDQHNAMASVAEQWLRQAGLHARGQKIAPQKGVDLMRHYFKIDVTLPPRIIIDPSCRGLLSELGYCPSPTLHKMAAWAYHIGPDGHATSTMPMNHYNHSCMALIYLLFACFGNPYRGGETRAAPAVYHMVNGKYRRVAKD